MSTFKKLAIVAVFAAVAVMLTASGTASAKFCSTSGVGAACGGTHGKVYKGKIKEILTPGKKAVLSSGFITVSCTEATQEGEITNESGGGVITSSTYGGCTNNAGGGACTVTSSASAETPWSTQTTPTSEGNGTETITNVTISINCTVFGLPVKCIYAAADAGGGGEIAFKGKHEFAETVETSVALAKEAGSSAPCSSTATQSRELTVFQPATLYVTP